MKEKALGVLKDFVWAVLAGISISIGCVAFLSSGNKIVGSLFFTIGLFIILNFDFNLFTGRVCVALDKKPNYILKLALIWVGNFVGALLSAIVVRATRLESLTDAATVLVETKLNDSALSVFLLGILCNILIFLAVYGYKNFGNSIAQALALAFGVSVFVLCGFEHCVADMFYFTFAWSWSWKMIGYLLLITLGNIVGGLLIPACLKLFNKNKN
ncbi:MAG: formate/nitrite transporter family protein [Clostridia bacterium]|nr:formate/nitrite transporter family protein [Clostridia bacterium]